MGGSSGGGMEAGGKSESSAPRAQVRFRLRRSPGRPPIAENISDERAARRRRELSKASGDKNKMRKIKWNYVAGGGEWRGRGGRG